MEASYSEGYIFNHMPLLFPVRSPPNLLIIIGVHGEGGGGMKMMTISTTVLHYIQISFLLFSYFALLNFFQNQMNFPKRKDIL